MNTTERLYDLARILEGIVSERIPKWDRGATVRELVNQWRLEDRIARLEQTSAEEQDNDPNR